MTMPDYALNNPIDKDIFQKFISDEMKVKEFKGFSEPLINRLVYIIHTIGEVTGFTVGWLDYGNNAQYDGDNGSVGYFDTDEYQTEVDYTGEFNYSNKDRLDKYDNKFPTRWFYENFENELKKEQAEHLKEVEKSAKKKLEKTEQEKARVLELKDKILSKLTKEELSILCFASKDDIAKKKTIAHIYLKPEEDKTKNELAQFLKRMKDKNIAVTPLYTEYRENNKGSKKSLNFNQWVVKNMKKIEASV